MMNRRILLVAGAAKDLGEGVALAAASIDQGKARSSLDTLINVSNS